MLGVGQNFNGLIILVYHSLCSHLSATPSVAVFCRSAMSADIPSDARVITKDLASHYKRELQTFQTRSGGFLTDEQIAYRREALGQRSAVLRGRHAEELRNFLKRHADNMSTRKLEHSSISVSSASEQPLFPASGAPEHLVIETKRERPC